MQKPQGDVAVAFLSVFVVVGSIACLTIFLTSDLTPLGRHVYQLLAQADANPASGGLHPYQVSLGICVLLLFLGYLLDLHLRTGGWIWGLFVQRYCAIVGLFLLAGAILYSTEAPSIPPLVGVGAGTCAVQLLRAYAFSDLAPEDFSLAASAAYAAAGLCCTGLWAAWAFTPWMGYHSWDWKELVRPSIDTQGFVRWCSPFLLALVHVLIALFLRLRGRMHKIDEYVIAELKLVCSSLILLALFTWLAASVAAGDVGLSKVVLRLSVVLSVGVAAYLICSLGPTTIISACETNEALSLVMPLFLSDWAKGAFVLVFLPLTPVCFAVELLHMAVRRTLHQCGWAPQDCSGSSWITSEAAYVVDAMCRWNAGSVLSKCITLGIIYFMVQVGCGRGVVVLLAWICERSLRYSLPAILGILYGVGVGLFLFPPVPGCPIYMVSSILITKRFEATGGHFLLATLLSLCLSLVTKLSGTAMQQKLIGERFSHSVYVKRLVAIHTPEMKAIRHILSQSGLRSAKVAVLVCAPDWPTSVFTGILRLPLLQMLLGTLPVVLIILPFTLSGSFMVHAAALPDDTLPKRRYEGLANAFVFLAMLVQMAGMVLIAQYTHATMDEYRDQIEKGDWMKDEQEEEVLREIEREEVQRQLLQESTGWSVLPWWVRVDLVLGSLLASLMMHIILLPFLKPFQDFSLNDKFSDIGGVYFFVNKPGWVAIAFLCCSAGCLLLFEAWCARTLRVPKEKRPLVSSKAAAGPSYHGTGIAVA